VDERDKETETTAQPSAVDSDGRQPELIGEIILRALARMAREREGPAEAGKVTDDMSAGEEAH
jgi:hypothetical protein